MGNETGEFRTDERAVSPVIAVVLMVAIVVLLGAVISAAVFGVGAENIEAAREALDSLGL